MCDCIEDVNKHLAEYNTRILIPMIGPQRPFVETEKVKAGIRGKPRRMFATFCPFCGEKLPRDEAADEAAADQ